MESKTKGLASLQNRLNQALKKKGPTVPEALSTSSEELNAKLLWHVCLFACLTLFRNPTFGKVQKEKVLSILETMSAKPWPSEPVFGHSILAEIQGSVATKGSVRQIGKRAPTGQPQAPRGRPQAPSDGGTSAPAPEGLPAAPSSATAMVAVAPPGQPGAGQEGGGAPGAAEEAEGGGAPGEEGEAAPGVVGAGTGAACAAEQGQRDGEAPGEAAAGGRGPGRGRGGRGRGGRQGGRGDEGAGAAAGGGAGKRVLKAAAPKAAAPPKEPKRARR